MAGAQSAFAGRTGMGRTLRIIISGGGTGGHIFPGISIADAIRAARPEAEILFVGAEGRMEMQRVPAAGYEIRGLPIRGFDRRNMLRNAVVVFKILESRRLARRIFDEFKPVAAVGVGGYASGPALNVAQSMGIPTLLQEQNSYAGVANRLLAKKAARICVAYEGMERFFPKEKIMLTGNPVRRGLSEAGMSREEAVLSFGLDPARRTVLVMGGSLGARAMNEAVLGSLTLIRQSDVQFIWQTGGYYSLSINTELEQRGKPANLAVRDFIADMAAAYKAADLVVSRAGAGSISEMALLGKAAILVPSPNVAEDHQTKNALALASRGAALYVKDAEVARTLIPCALNAAADSASLSRLRRSISEMAHPDAAETIAREVIGLAETYGNKF